MQEEFLTFKETLKVECKERQLDLIVHSGNTLQIFEKSFALNGQVTLTNYNLMGAKFLDQNTIHLYTLQGIVGWDLQKNEEIFFIQTEEIYCGDSGPQYEVCTAHEKAVMVWDVRRMKAINCIMAHSMTITSIHFNPNALYITTSGQDNCCRVLHTYLPECLKTLALSKLEQTTHSQFLNDSRHVLLQTIKNPLSIWDWAKSEVVATYSTQKLENTRFILPPKIIYNNEVPTHILQANENGLLGKYDVLKPYQEPLIMRIFDAHPVRFTIDKDQVYVQEPEGSSINVYGLI